MWGTFQNWLWNDFFGPLNKRRFKFRIANRVRWLFFKRWWKENIQPIAFLKGLKRPTVLLLVGLGIPVLSAWFGLRFLPLPAEGSTLAETIEWRAIVQPLIIFIGAPAAFILWAFRDLHAQANLENQRKDINLKEFQEIQMRAAGALDEKLPEHARQTLQIAAIHQLRPFLRGEYGKSFRRPAWELLKARMATSAIETGYQALTDWTDQGAFSLKPDETAGDRGRRIGQEIRKTLDTLRPGPIALAERAALGEEASRIFRKDLPLSQGRYGDTQLENCLLAGLDLRGASFVNCPLSGAHLEGADLSNAHLEGAVLLHAHLEGAYLIRANLEGAYLGEAQLEGADLTDAHLEGAYLIRANLEGAYLIRANLEGAALKDAHLEGAYLRDAHLEGAGLFSANLEGAYLIRANLEGAYLREAHLEGADLREAHLEGADLIGALLKGARLSFARFDDATILVPGWDDLPPSRKAAHRNEFRRRGALHVRDEKWQ